MTSTHSPPVPFPDRRSDRPARQRPVRSWPVLLLAAPAFVAIWSGWVGLGEMTGFGVVHPLPGIWDDLRINTAITLPIGVETYAAFALRAWLSGSVPVRARRFAKWSAIGSLMLGAAGQVAYHLMAAAGITQAPWQITALVACLPVAVLGMGAALAHLLHAPADTLPVPTALPTAAGSQLAAAPAVVGPTATDRPASTAWPLQADIPGRGDSRETPVPLSGHPVGTPGRGVDIPGHEEDIRGSARGLQRADSEPGGGIPPALEDMRGPDGDSRGTPVPLSGPHPDMGGPGANTAQIGTDRARTSGGHLADIAGAGPDSRTLALAVYQEHLDRTGQPPTGPDLAGALGVSARHGRRLLRELAAQQTTGGDLEDTGEVSGPRAADVPEPGADMRPRKADTDDHPDGIGQDTGRALTLEGRVPSASGSEVRT